MVGRKKSAAPAPIEVEDEDDYVPSSDDGEEGDDSYEEDSNTESGEEEEEGDDQPSPPRSPSPPPPPPKEVKKVKTRAKKRKAIEEIAKVEGNGEMEKEKDVEKVEKRKRAKKVEPKIGKINTTSTNKNKDEKTSSSEVVTKPFEPYYEIQQEKTNIIDMSGKLTKYPRDKIMLDERNYIQVMTVTIKNRGTAYDQLILGRNPVTTFVTGKDGVKTPKVSPPYERSYPLKVIHSLYNATRYLTGRPQETEAEAAKYAA